MFQSHEEINFQVFAEFQYLVQCFLSLSVDIQEFAVSSWSLDHWSAYVVLSLTVTRPANTMDYHSD